MKITRNHFYQGKQIKAGETISDPDHIKFANHPARNYGAALQVAPKGKKPDPVKPAAGDNQSQTTKA